MKTTRIGAVMLLVAIGGLALAACGRDESSGVADESTISPTPSGRVPTADVSAKENGMKIVITAGGQSFRATLADSAASHDLLAQLPQTVEMTDHGGVEKTGPLRSALSLSGQPSGADPDVGDLGYYAPGNDLVLYYGNQSYFEGIVILGKLEGDSAQRISELTGRVTVTVEAG